MKKTGWARLIGRSLKLMTGPAAKKQRRATQRLVDQAVQSVVGSAVKATRQATKATRSALQAPPGPGDWLAGVAMGAGAMRRWRLYRPPDLPAGAPLLVMLHGCGQDARSFAVATRMNRVADRHGFLVLYPEQDRLANPQGCWHWFDTDGGRAAQEAALIFQAIDQVCRRHGADRSRVALAGLSAGASMAALLATRQPQRFKAVVMHSGVPPGLAHSTASALGAMQGRRTHGAARRAAPDAKAIPWPPLLVIHGGADRIVSVDNAHAAVALWAAAAGASATAPRAVQRGQRHPMVVTTFQAGGRTTAQIVQIERLGHAWSGGAARQPHSDPQGPDASRMAWAFIAKQLA